jgi:hypothetical protein
MVYPGEAAAQIVLDPSHTIETPLETCNGGLVKKGRLSLALFPNFAAFAGEHVNLAIYARIPKGFKSGTLPIALSSEVDAFEDAQAAIGADLGARIDTSEGPTSIRKNLVASRGSLVFDRFDLPDEHSDVAAEYGAKGSVQVLDFTATDGSVKGTFTASFAVGVSLAAVDSAAGDGSDPPGSSSGSGCADSGASCKQPLPPSGENQRPTYCAAAATFACFISHGCYAEAGAPTSLTRTQLKAGCDDSNASAVALGGGPCLNCP